MRFASEMWPLVAPEWILNGPEWLRELGYDLYKCFIFYDRYMIVV